MRGSWWHGWQAAWLEAWYTGHPALTLLLPLSLLYGTLARLRRMAYAGGLLRQVRLPVPVVVVGNLTLGGTGKTPLTIWLARHLVAAGWRVGIVSRGYGGHASEWPQQVRGDSDPGVVGDEAVLIARRTGVPMAVAPERVAAARALIEACGCNLILSDDGLQHYALARDIEIAVVDGVRRLGNRHCLPAGPLREPQSRLKAVDLIVTQGLAERGEFAMSYRPLGIYPLRPGQPLGLDHLRGQRVHCVTGIGNPQGFFALVRSLGAQVIPHAYPDHHEFAPEELQFEDADLVLMTEKDAVKCERFATARLWYLPVEASLPPVFAQRFDNLLRTCAHGQETA
jgi:tetraacyldisaccharide 4'-kinase